MVKFFQKIEYYLCPFMRKLLVECITFRMSAVSRRMSTNKTHVVVVFQTISTKVVYHISSLGKSTNSPEKTHLSISTYSDQD